MNKDLVYWLIYTFAITTISGMESRYKLFALLTTSFKFIYFYKYGDLEETGGTSLFAKIKRYSIYIPVIFYSLALFYPLKISEHIFTLVLLINIIEAAVLLEFIEEDIRSKLSGLCIIVCALLTPKLLFHNGLLSFKDNKLWGWLNAFTLTGAYLFNSEFKGGNSRYSAILSVLLPSVVSTKYNYYWMSTRAYSLNNVLFIDDIYPRVHDKLTANINYYFEPSNKKYTKARILYTLLTILFTLYSIPQMYKHSYLYSLLN